jgi:hypothetical protein
MAFAIAAIACGGENASQAPAAAPTSEPAAPSDANRSTRPATESECQSILQGMAATCERISGTHSAQIDAWCTEVRARTSDGAWITDECLKHVRYVDYRCFMSDPGIGNQMDCETAVEKTPQP